ncbi:nucleotidyltransferase domain-containing protein [bacterium]|nr:nucleotidyltransferase domain-containing protein [bacterium]
MQEELKVKKICDNFIETLKSNALLDWIDSIYLYGSAADETYLSKDSNIDLMILCNVDERGQLDSQKLIRLYELHKNYVEKIQLPFEIYTYGSDEIPTENTLGYSLLRSMFIYDYFEKAKLIYGINLLQKFLKPDVEESSILLANDMRRGLRQMVYNSPYLSNRSVLSRMVGDRSGGTTFVTEDISKYLDDRLRYATVCLIFTMKAHLLLKGQQVSGKNKIFKTYLEFFPGIERKNELLELFEWWRGHKSKEYHRWGLGKDDFQYQPPEQSRLQVLLCLEIVEDIAKSMQGSIKK